MVCQMALTLMVNRVTFATLPVVRLFALLLST